MRSLKYLLLVLQSHHEPMCCFTDQASTPVAHGASETRGSYLVNPVFFSGGIVNQLEPTGSHLA